MIEGPEGGTSDLTTAAQPARAPTSLRSGGLS